MSKRLSLFALLAVLAMLAAACSTTEADPTTTAAPVVEEPTETSEAMESTSVLDLAVEAGQFNTLIAAIEAAGLESTLQGAGPFTVFAPTDAAFAAAFDTLGITAEDLLADTDTLTQILTYHVAPQAADSQLVATLDGQEVPTVNGQGVMISVDSGLIKVNDAEVVSADLVADNGIVHVINGVLLPPDIAISFDSGDAAMDDEQTIAGIVGQTIAGIVGDLAAADDAEFTVLLAALEQAQLVDALNNADDELTVFAPTDEAFAAALEALGITAEELLASDDLSSILLYHVVPGAFDAAAVVSAAPIDALETLDPDGSTLSIEVVDGAVVINGTATVVTPDVAAGNGIIHVIDTVLLP
jgi:transforming growth factor-beta-induced protein